MTRPPIGTLLLTTESTLSLYSDPIHENLPALPEQRQWPPRRPLLSAPVQYRFADLTLNLDKSVVLRGDAPVELPKLSFRLLVVLVEAAPALVTYEQLVDRVWGPNRVVSPENLSQRLLMLRKSLGEDAANPRYIEAVRGQGMRLIPECERVTAESNPFSDRSIAVLPFVNMSEDAANEYFSDGISEEILNVLAKIPQLKVISRSSSFAFRNQSLSIPEVSKRLNARNVLEGSVRKSGNRVRITAQLIEAESDTHLWSETFDRSLDDIFEVQEEIAATVAGELKVRLLGEKPSVRLTNPAAYELVLQARHCRSGATNHSIAQATELYQRAVLIDPDYATAWSEMAHCFEYGRFATRREPGETKDLGRQAANRALSIDPDCALAYSVLGSIELRYDRDIVLAAQHFQRAVDLAPFNDSVLFDAWSLPRALGQFDDLVAISERLVGLSQYDPTYHMLLGYSHRSAGNFDAAIASLRSALALNPDSILAHYGIGDCLVFKGRHSAALEAMAREQVEYLRLTGMATAYWHLDQRGHSDRALEELIRKYGRTHAGQVVKVCCVRGELDDAFDWLEKAAQADDPELLVTVPHMANLSRFYSGIASDPRWGPMLDRIGLSPSIVNAIEFRLPSEG